MWTDSEDLAIISDLYQVRIKIITTKGLSDKNPTVNYISPDKDMAQFAELKNVGMNEMVLMHEDDLHFNLVVSKYSELATYGSLSHRLIDGSNMGENKEIDDDVVVTESHEADNKFQDELKELKKITDEKQ